jgi:endonuclease YncB( thermonuclease family)
MMFNNFRNIFKLCFSFPNKKNIDILDCEDAPELSFEDKFCLCKVVDVYDGDTITIVIAFENKPYKIKCRLSGVDSAEIRTKNLEEKTAGVNAKHWLSEKILNKKLWIKCGNWDKYGRLLGEIFTNKDDTVSINQELIDKKYAYQYDGKKKRKFDEWSK